MRFVHAVTAGGSVKFLPNIMSGLVGSSDEGMKDVGIPVKPRGKNLDTICQTTYFDITAPNGALE